jgi:PAS domain S-box-containing protein
MKMKVCLKNFDVLICSLVLVCVYIGVVFLETADPVETGAGIFSPRFFTSIIFILLMGFLAHRIKRKFVAFSCSSREKEAMLTALSENFPDIIWFKDSHQKYLFVNHAFLRECGKQNEDVIGKSTFDVWPADTAEKFNADDEKIHKMGDRIHVEHRIDDNDGTVSWVEIIKNPIVNEDGLIVASVGAARNITQRKQAETDRKVLENQLRQSQKMEAIGTLAGGIAHDFNNILAAIMGYTEISLDEITGDCRLKERLERILKAGYRGKELVDQILTFSRQNEREKQTIVLSTIVEEAVKMLRPLIPTNITIRTNLEKSSQSVIGDSGQAHQILVNLCTNAAHAMQETGGELDINLEDVHLEEDFTKKHVGLKPGPYVRLSLRDSGHGIPEEDIPRVFEPFFTRKKQGDGTGMGLSVVHGIVTSLKGTIDVYSKPGKGTTFTILLPGSQDRCRLGEKEETPVSRGNECIMLVDDEIYIVDMVKEMLESLGYTVAAFRDSGAALNFFHDQKDNVQVVITDMAMPGMTGEELSRELINIRTDVPIILCTGFSQTLSSDEAISLGIQDYIMKPFVKQELATSIRNVLDRAA